MPRVGPSSTSSPTPITAARIAPRENVKYSVGTSTGIVAAPASRAHAGSRGGAGGGMGGAPGEPRPRRLADRRGQAQVEHEPEHADDPERVPVGERELEALDRDAAARRELLGQPPRQQR